MATSDLAYQLIGPLSAWFARIPSGGAFTPVIAGSTAAGSYTYAIQTGTYQQIGAWCHVVGRVQLSAVSSYPTGNIQITGLPLPGNATATGAGFSGLLNVLSSNLAWPATYTQVGLYVVPGQTYGYLGASKNNAGWSAVDAGGVSTTTDIWFSGVYLV